MSNSDICEIKKKTNPQQQTNTVKHKPPKSTVGQADFSASNWLNWNGIILRNKLSDCFFSFPDGKTQCALCARWFENLR